MAQMFLGEASAFGEAPGRLDVLGGVADYSGSLVLQMPTRATTRVEITAILQPQLCFASTQNEALSLPLQTLHSIKDADVATWINYLNAQELPQWSRYPLGCFLLFCQAFNWWPRSGLSFNIESAVPTSMGVSSSAALEVATLRALEQLSGLHFEGTELAKLAQRAENEIVGAPCGLMDQLASAHGIHGALLPILCRPDVLSEPVPLPDGVLVAGWPSGVKHSIADSPYATARCASFMGKKILEIALSFNAIIRLQHITELAPSQVRSVGEEVLPTSLSGAEFIARFGGVDDALSTVEPERIYPVRAAALFPVEENFRCRLALQLLQSPSHYEALTALGELMYQSHAGYSSIGLDSPETDIMVEAIRKLGPQHGFYGARVSGGGSGGTVVVLLEKSALPTLENLVAKLTPDLTLIF